MRTDNPRQRCCSYLRWAVRDAYPRLRS